MIFNSKNVVKKKGRFVLPENVIAKVSDSLSDSIFADFWKGFSFGFSEIVFEKVEDFVFLVGEADILNANGNAYAINVTEKGISISANDHRGLVMGFMTLMDRVQIDDLEDDVQVFVDCFELVESPLIENRMVHLCVLPETELWELKKFVRLVGALKFSHIILEFWGMYKFECMNELAWSFAFSKEDMRQVINEAKTLGLEIIPMFNHWGHATGSRVMHGKHVVLDQNPSLQTYFTEDGWCWDIKKPKVKNLLKKIREEMIDLCGEGEYFHIGCDEAYNYELTMENIDFISNYINEVNEEIAQMGRRTIIWGDMFLYRYSHYNPNNRYHCGAPTEEAAKYFISRIDKNIVMADWQYNSNEAPVETVDVFLKAGFDTLLCSWDRSMPKFYSCVRTIKDNNMFGMLHTTWHTLSSGTPYILLAAVSCFEDAERDDFEVASTLTASLIRKIFPSGGIYEKTGWAKYQISVIT